MDREQTTIRQLTIRMANEMFETTKMEAEKINSSHNSFLMMMVSLGMKLYNGKVTIDQSTE